MSHHCGVTCCRNKLTAKIKGYPLCSILPLFKLFLLIIIFRVKGRKPTAERNIKAVV